MYAPQEACGVVFNVKLSFHVVGFALWLLRSALRLQPSELITDAFLFGRRMPFFFGWPALFPDRALPFGKITVVLFHNGLRLAVTLDRVLYIGIAVLF